MKSDDELFDDFLRSKLSLNKFELKDEYWQKAKALIDEQRPAKRRFWILFTLPVFLLVSGAILYFNDMEESKAKLTKTQGGTPQYVTDNTGSTINQSHRQFSTVNAGQQQPLFSMPVNAGALSSQTATETNQELNKPVSETNSSSLIIINKQSATAAHKTLAGNNIPVADLATQMPVAPLSTKPSSDNYPEQATTTLISENAEGDNTTGSQHDAMLTGISITPLWKNRLELVYSMNHSKAYMPARSVKNKHVVFNAEAGLTWYNPSGVATDNADIYIRAMAEKPLSAKISIAAGIGYARFHQRNGSRSYDVVANGFGETIQTISINTTRLDYIEIPFSASFAFYNRHRLTAGAMFAYIVSSSDLVKQQYRSAYDKKTSNYYGAFNRSDVQLITSYSYSLSPKWFISTAYYYGVTDITKNKSFKRNSFNNNQGLRLGLGYKF